MVGYQGHRGKQSVATYHHLGHYKLCSAACPTKMHIQTTLSEE
jgi:hypothetical protein